MIRYFLSSLLYDCYDLQAYPAQYCNPDWTNECRILMIGFVDNRNGQVNFFHQDDNTSTLKEMVLKAKKNASTTPSSHRRSP
jgi:hypothetical protein